MLEKKFTIPVLFGICLGLILTGVQISVTALNSAVGGQQGLVLFDSGREEAGTRVMGKNLRITLPHPDEFGQIRENTRELADNIVGSCRERVVGAGNKIEGLLEPGRDRVLGFYRKWIRTINMKGS